MKSAPPGTLQRLWTLKKNLKYDPNVSDPLQNPEVNKNPWEIKNILKVQLKSLGRWKKQCTPKLKSKTRDNDDYNNNNNNNNKFTSMSQFHQTRLLPQTTMVSTATSANPNDNRMLNATSHTSHEPWPWNCESPKESVQSTSKGYPKTPPKNHVVWTRIPKCSVKPYVTGSSTKCYFNK